MEEHFTLSGSFVVNIILHLATLSKFRTCVANANASLSDLVLGDPCGGFRMPITKPRRGPLRYFTVPTRSHFSCRLSNLTFVLNVIRFIFRVIYT